MIQFQDAELKMMEKENSSLDLSNSSTIIDEEWTPHSFESDDSSSSRGSKRMRSSPLSEQCCSLEPKKDVASQKQKLLNTGTLRSSPIRSTFASPSRQTGQDYAEWVSENFSSIPLAREASYQAELEGDFFRCFETDSGICFVRHGKIHQSILGWVESCSVAMKEQNLISPSLFSGHERVALKVFHLPKVFSTQSRENALQELQIHSNVSKLGHQNISQFLGCFRCEDKVFAVFPMFERGDLFEYLALMEAKGKRMSEKQIRTIMRNAAQAVKACHEAGYCHRDVSLENFCVSLSSTGDQTENVMPVLIDFGVASRMADVQNGLVAHTGPIGKAKYMAPELHSTVERMPFYDGTKADVFSLGVMLLILIIQMEPWDSTSFADRRFVQMIYGGELRSVVNILGSMYSDTLVDLLVEMLDMDPTKRPNTEEIMARLR